MNLWEAENVFRPREMWAMKESGSESKRACLNVLNSVSLKWAFIQYSVLDFQCFYNRWYKI